MNLESDNQDIFDNDSEELFSLLKVTWNKPKEEIWETWSKERKKTSVITMKPKTNQWILAVAASVVLLISIGVFMSTYTTSYETLAGEHFSANLPDGSKVYLNAESVIKYKPFLWWAKRQVELKGEAFFEVEKGKVFKVKSVSGITEVLGTSFNIYSRNEKYEVTCVSGKVKVKAVSTQHSIILHPNEKASLQKSGQLIVDEKVNADSDIAWISNKFVFTSVFLEEAFSEIERQYDITIEVPKDLSLVYTGSFEKVDSVEKILSLVCRPFGLKYEKLNEEHFAISFK